MKNKLTSAATIFLLSLTLVACGGGGRPSAESVDNLMESLSLRLDMAKKAYDSYVIMLPTEGGVMSGSMAQVGYDVMLKSLKEQQDYLAKTETFESDAFAKEKSEALKKATKDILDAYDSGAKNELADALKLAKQGKNMESPEMAEKLAAFEESLVPKYEAFAKVQAELAKEYNIILM